MDKKIKISELPEFDATRHLEDEEDIAMLPAVQAAA